MKRNNLIICILCICIVGAVSLPAAGINFSQIQLSDSPEIGKSINVTIMGIAESDISSIQVVGGVNTKLLFSKVESRWLKGKKKWFTFTWVPDTPGTNVLFFESDPSRKIGMYNRMTLSVKVPDPGGSNPPPPADPPPPEDPKKPPKFPSFQVPTVDLAIKEIRLQPATPRKGDDLDYKITVLNEGNTATLKPITIVLKQDNTEICNLKGSSNLSPGTSEIFTCTSKNLSVGKHTYAAEAIPSPSDNETYKANNIASGEFRVPSENEFAGPGANLPGIPSNTFTGQATGGQFITFSDSIPPAVFDWKMMKNGKELGYKTYDGKKTYILNDFNGNLDMSIVFHFNQDTFTGKILNVQFKSKHFTGSCQGNPIIVNKEIKTTMKGAKEVLLTDLPVRDIICLNGNRQDVTLMINFANMKSIDGGAKGFLLELPDLIYQPQEYKKKCERDAAGNIHQKVSIRGLAIDLYGHIRGKQRFSVRVNWWNYSPSGLKEFSNNISFTGLQNAGDISEEYFYTSVSGYTKSTPSGTWLEVCVTMDPEKRIKEINRGNNKACFDISLSENNTKCTPDDRWLKIYHNEVTYKSD